MHNEALLRPREGTQQAPVKVGARDTQVCERLWLTLATRRVIGSAYHRYIVPHATDRKYATRCRGAMTEPSLQELEADRARTVPAAVEVEGVRAQIRAGTTRQPRNHSLDNGL